MRFEPDSHQSSSAGSPLRAGLQVNSLPHPLLVVEITPLALLVLCTGQLVAASVLIDCGSYWAALSGIARF